MHLPSEHAKKVDLILGTIFAGPPLIYGLLCLLQSEAVVFAYRRTRGWKSVDLTGTPAQIAGLAYLALACGFIVWLPNLGGSHTRRVRSVLGWVAVVIAGALGLCAAMRG